MEFLNYSCILNKTFDNKNNIFAYEYFNKLFSYYYNNSLPCRYTYPLAAIKAFVLLPTKLLLPEDLYINTDLIEYDLNLKEYKFKGSHGNRLVFADKFLPHLNCPIPFIFPICTDEYIDIVLSNVYYYEVKINIGYCLHNYQHIVIKLIY